MGQFMGFIVVLGRKLFGTFITMERLFSGVDFLMSFEIRDLGEI